MQELLNILSVCLDYCLSYPACKSYLYFVALCCHTWRIWLHRMLPHYLINNTTLGKKKILNIKCAFWFSLHLSCEIFLILRRIRRDIILYVYWSSRNVLELFSTGFNEIWTFLTDFRKMFKYQISWKSFQLSRAVSCGQTDGQTWLLAILWTRCKSY